MEPMSGTAAMRKYLSFITKIKLISFGSSSEETPPQTNEVQQTQASSLTMPSVADVPFPHILCPTKGCKLKEKQDTTTLEVGIK